MTTNDGGPAFPCIYERVGEDQCQGMSMRAYIATHALAGMLASDASEGDEADFARWSVEYADALLAELGKGKS